MVQLCGSDSNSIMSHSGSGTDLIASCSSSFCNVELAMMNGQISYTKYIAVQTIPGHVTSNNVWFPLATNGVLQIMSLEGCNATVSLSLIGFC